MTQYYDNHQEETEIDTRAYYHGSVNQDAYTFCHFRVEEDGRLRGIFIANGDGFHIHPADDLFDGATDFDHVIFRDSAQPMDLNQRNVSVDGACGISAEDAGVVPPQGGRHRRAAYVNGKNSCPIKLVADYAFFANVGSGSAAQARDAMVARLNLARVVFEDNTVFTNVKDFNGSQAILRLQVKNLQVYSTPGSDPYNSITDAYTLLDTFSSVNFDDFCLGHLFTYKGVGGFLLVRSEHFASLSPSLLFFSCFDCPRLFWGHLGTGFCGLC